ncbi:MAG: hypothetical protein VX777_01560 [Chlamydiota bacterium]|nr:hypothetical protein [Chlamydiota bacterium]
MVNFSTPLPGTIHQYSLPKNSPPNNHLNSAEAIHGLVTKNQQMSAVIFTPHFVKFNFYQQAMKKLFIVSPEKFWETLEAMPSLQLRIATLSWILLRVNSKWPDFLLSLVRGGDNFISDKVQKEFLNSFMDSATSDWKKNFFYYCLENMSIHTYASILHCCINLDDIDLALSVFIETHKSRQIEDLSAKLLEAVLISMTPPSQTYSKGFTCLTDYILSYFKREKLPINTSSFPILINSWLQKPSTNITDIEQWGEWIQKHYEDNDTASDLFYICEKTYCSLSMEKYLSLLDFCAKQCNGVLGYLIFSIPIQSLINLIENEKNNFLKIINSIDFSTTDSGYVFFEYCHFRKKEYSNLLIKTFVYSETIKSATSPFLLGLCMWEDLSRQLILKKFKRFPETQKIHLSKCWPLHTFYSEFQSIFSSLPRHQIKLVINNIPDSHLKTFLHYQSGKLFSDLNMIIIKYNNVMKTKDFLTTYSNKNLPESCLKIFTDQYCQEKNEFIVAISQLLSHPHLMFFTKKANYLISKYPSSSKSIRSIPKILPIANDLEQKIQE